MIWLIYYIIFILVKFYIWNLSLSLNWYIEISSPELANDLDILKQQNSLPRSNIDAEHMHIRWLKGVNTKHESQSSLEELTSWKMDAAVLDWNVSWVFDIENSPRDKPFSCVIKMENKTTESLGAFTLLSLMIISTEVHISEQSCKVNTIFFYSPLKEPQITSLVLLRPQWVIPHASWMEWGYFHDILF